MAKFEDYWFYDEPNAEKRELMATYATVFESCRKDDCSVCKYRHGEDSYKMLQCMGERFADALVEAGYKREA